MQPANREAHSPDGRVAIRIHHNRLYGAGS